MDTQDENRRTDGRHSRPTIDAQRRATPRSTVSNDDEGARRDYRSPSDRRQARPSDGNSGTARRRPSQRTDYDPRRPAPSREPKSSGGLPINLQVPIDLGNERTRYLIVGIVAVLIIVVLAFAACSATGSKKKDSADDATEEPVEAVAYSASPDALDDVPSSGSLKTFTLSSDEAPSLSDEQTAAIEEAIAACEEYGEVGIVFYDVETGLGISYNVDAEIYGADSFKAPYALYLCEDLVEGGTVELDDIAADLETSLGDYGSSTYLTLRDTYDSVDFDDWVASLGAEDASYLEDSHYPWYCARSSAKLWTEMYLYLQTGSEAAAYLEELLGESRTSFIGNGISDTGAAVLNNAGWYAGSESKYDSVSDAGIIELDGHTYIMSVMTYMPSSDTTQSLCADLCAALFDARDALNDGDEAATDDE